MVSIAINVVWFSKSPNNNIFQGDSASTAGSIYRPTTWR